MLEYELKNALSMLYAGREDNPEIPGDLQDLLNEVEKCRKMITHRTMSASDMATIVGVWKYLNAKQTKVVRVEGQPVAAVKKTKKVKNA